ncbi:choline-sulfatase [soil metagenome]
MKRPNILVLMADQLTGTLFPDGPADWLHVPHLRALAGRARRFARCYTASPLCAPARASIMTGLLPSRTGVYDNADEFASALPTFAHVLRRAGYATTLAGKMHFVGPDQLHGFEERLTTDIYPADFGWTPDWSRPGERVDWWYHNLGSVTGAGTAEITNQLEYDDEVAHLGAQKLYDLARRHDPRPWCLTVSFSHPHDPFLARRRHWDLYAGSSYLAPEVGALTADEHDPHSRRLLDACDWRACGIMPEQVALAHRGYFASSSYRDEKIGELLATLKAARFEEDTMILFTADHGEMLGERGLWFKMSFREGSARVPLLLAGPGIAEGCAEHPVSTLDIAPTLAALAGVRMPEGDGENLMAAARGPVPMEYAAEGAVAPMVALVEDCWKYVACPADPPQLFDLASDRHEMTNCAGLSRGTAAQMSAAIAARWDLDAFDGAVRASQARRHLGYEALRGGAYYPWDFQPLRAASERYMRNHKDLNVLEDAQRFPRGA